MLLKSHDRAVLAAFVLFALSSSVGAAVRFVWLDELDISKVEAGWGSPKRNASIEGHPISIGGRKFERGLGTHAPSVMWIKMDGWTSHFSAFVGVDDGVGKAPGSVEFIVFGKGEVLWQSGLMKAGDPAKEVNVLTRGVQKLGLIVTDGGDGIAYDHANWADAKLRVTGQDPRAMSPGAVEPYILTPAHPKTPRINGPDVFGVRAGSPVLYTIAATGDRPMTFGAKNLPKGLSLDKSTGRITGTLSKESEYKVTLTAQNALGAGDKEFRIVVGDRICLTPPLGWNSWNCWAGAVDAEKIKSAARAMVDTGLVNHGWTYINIDDSWQGPRGGSFNAIQGNERFPDMKGLCDYVHSLGLKIGIYSTPWVTSYAEYIGGSADNPEGTWSATKDPRFEGWRHGTHAFAVNDAKQWAAWGVDYVKYDWNPNDVPHAAEMADALRGSGRDIIYSLSNGAPFEHAADWAKLANCWRTTGDIVDSWASISEIGFSQDKWAPFAGPGHFNDADMLVIGHVGWGPNLHASHLTPDEQYTHLSLWCLLSSPLLLGCDLAALDAFTLNLLTNDEVLAVNQDALGIQAVQVAGDETYAVYAKGMADGSKAVGLFNRDSVYDEPKAITLTFDDLGIGGDARVRDLWRQTDLGVFKNSYTTDVPAHGVVLLQVFPE
ncbi:MAG: NPCBM/NEW2 domain-containing protein [Phycisphaerae bacterium]|nr:NPCBM/NEW2 domain-containing protein [Phycisphaerae bacterium]